MSRQSRYDLANRALNGELEGILTRARAVPKKDRVSFEDIAFGLRLRDIEVSGETVRQWCKALGLELEPAS